MNDKTEGALVERIKAIRTIDADNVHSVFEVLFDCHDTIERQARELAEARGICVQSFTHGHILRLTDEVRALQARLERLRGALEKYGVHYDCEMLDENNEYIWVWDPDKAEMVQPACTCGLSKALADTQGEG